MTLGRGGPGRHSARYVPATERIAETGSARTTRRHLVALIGAALAAAVIGSACGQYPGVHRDPAVQAQDPVVTTPVSVATPVAGSNGSGKAATTTAHHAVADGAEDPEQADIQGGSGSVSLEQIFATKGGKGGGSKNGSKDPSSNTGSGNGSGQGADPGNGKRSGTGSSGTKNEGKSGESGSGIRGDDGADPGPPDIEGTIGPDTPTGDSLDLANLVSRETVPGAKYNSTVLPPGFPFLICPIQAGKYSYSDSYGAPRYAGGYHPHAGIDIFAEEGTPVVAPFDGYVERVPNTLGGNAVKVHGAQGYVYMAHLVAYGITDQDVKAGTVVGFVGTTGDAQGTSPHDHFEWHPNHVAAYDRQLADTNGAVDAFPYLQVICPPDPS